jgi:hypothetical protein
MTRDRWRGWLLLCVVFVCGALAGGAAVQIRTTRLLRQVVDGPAAGFEVRLKLLLLQRSLSLTAEQRMRLQPILEESAAKMRLVRRGVEPQLAPTRASERAAVRAVLTPEQRLEYDRRVSALDGALGRTP